jgi:hypothetical protein
MTNEIDKAYGLKLEYLKRETRIRMIMIFLRELLSIVALALIIALAALALRAVLAEAAETDRLQEEYAAILEGMEAAVNEIVAIRGPVPEGYDGRVEKTPPYQDAESEEKSLPGSPKAPQGHENAEVFPSVSQDSPEDFTEGSTEDFTGPALMPPEEPARPAAYRLTADELDLLERVTSAEVGGAQPYEGIIAVAETILNRSRLWGMTVTEVCEAPGQYTGPRRGEIPDEVRRAVADAVAGIKVFPGKDITHFHNESVTPYWAASKEFVGKIGNHLFYCGKEETK